MLFQNQKSSITAPAGCGKTQLIVSTLKSHAHEKPILILTHTNAGVAALRQRLSLSGIEQKKYRLATIDGWSLNLIRKFPQRSGHLPNILDLKSPHKDYPAIRKSASNLITKRHISEIIRASYSHLIVDEYQDCNLVQHSIICGLSREISTCVLGDPMQAIFNLSGNQLVSWEGDVIPNFPTCGNLTTPWRWLNSNSEELGSWLLNVRDKLQRGEEIDIREGPSNHVQWLSTRGDREDETRRKILPFLNSGYRTLIIGDSANTKGHQIFARNTPGAVVVESVSLDTLIDFAENFLLDSEAPFIHLSTLAQSVMTGVPHKEMARRLSSILSGRNKTPPTPAENAALDFYRSPNYEDAITFLEACREMKGTRLYRPTLFHATIESLRLSSQKSIPLLDSAKLTRESYRAKGRKIPKKGVGSTLLLKGLETELAIILNGDILSAHNLYVALSRASKQIVVCSKSPKLGFGDS